MMISEFRLVGFLLAFVRKLFLVFTPAAVGVFLSWFSVWMEQYHFLVGHSGIASFLGTVFLHAGAGMIFWWVVDMTVLEWFNIKDCIKGRGWWSGVSEIVRAAAIIGYFLLFGFVMFMFSNAGI